MDLDFLKMNYESHRPHAQRFMATIIEQLSNLIEKNEITLGTQIESRIKSIQSVEEKTKRKGKSIQCITDFDDFIGIRIIVLFKSDIDKTCDLIRKYFSVGDEEDVSRRLDSDQFGYQSTHYSIKIPEDWLKVPTLVGLGSYKAEVQVRTLSQHIWAVASHKLQYKQENNVPMPVRRSINRVSALLEIVDLEFERVLFEREKYIAQMDEEKEFNVDVLEVLCDRLLPKANKEFGNEDYSELFAELVANGITDVAGFIEMIEKHLSEQLREDKERVVSELHEGDIDDLSIERLQKGVFYTHVGLVRGCLRDLRGDDYESRDFE